MEWTGYALGGLFVGIGTTLGSGCTSGHGVCGIPRLSIRSITAVMTFMGVGAISATFIYDKLDLTVSESYITDELVNLHKYISYGVFIALQILTVIFFLKRVVTDPGFSKFSLVFPYMFGIIFGAGLLLSGMCRPSVVGGFLKLDAQWNPALMCVMGGALALNFLTFPSI